MRTSFISTMSLVNTPRSAITRMQSDLARLNKEVSTGRLADVGLELGTASGRSMKLHLDTAALDSVLASNGIATARLKQTDAALDGIASGADDFLQQLLAGSASSTSAVSLQTEGRSALAALTGYLNTSDGEGYLFAGINSATKPVAAYADGPQAAVDAAFMAKFGVAQDDPSVANIDAATMTDFIDNAFATLFDDPAWGNTWSSASDKAIASQISQSETIDTSISANKPAMRKLAMVYTMVGELGLDKLNDGARQAVLDRATSLLGSAIDGLTDIRANVGAAENRITTANDRMNVQRNLLDDQINAVEGVDSTEAKVKIDTLTTQIEMSYSLTAKLLNMSILNYV